MDKIRVYPVALGSNLGYSGFYTHGVLLAYAKAFNGGALSQYFDFARIDPIIPRDADRIIKELSSAGTPVVFLLSSYLWNHEQNMVFARKVRKAGLNALAIIGGPHIPKAEKPLAAFMLKNHCVDVAVRGEGERALAEVLEAVGQQWQGGSIRSPDLSQVPGLVFRTQDLKLVRTAEKQRIECMDDIPSPFQTGEFDHFAEVMDFAVIETNRGCPFGCTFCDWGGATLSKIKQFDLTRVFADLEWIARNHVEYLGIADANFGTFERDIAIAEKLVGLKRQYGYPKYAAIFLAKNTPQRVAKVVRILHSADMLVDAVASLQSTDPVVLENIQRSNIKESAYEDLIAVYHEIGMQPSTDIMLGLPGSDAASFLRSLQFSFDRHVIARTFPTMILPNSPMADEAYIQKFNIETDEQGYIVSAEGFDRNEYRRMETIRAASVMFVDEKLLKYLLLYLQVEHGLKAMYFIAQIAQIGEERAFKYPLIVWANQNLFASYRTFGGSVSLKWGDEAGYFFGRFTQFMTEVIHLADEIAGIRPPKDEVEAILCLQEGLLPKPGIIRSGPCEIPLSYDLMAYLEQFRPDRCPNLGSVPKDFRKLETFRKDVVLEIPQQPGLERTDYVFERQGFQAVQWTLDAKLPI